MSIESENILHELPYYATDAAHAYLNSLARVLYAVQGCVVKEGYDFSKSTHPTERMMYEMAQQADLHHMLENEGE